MIEGSALTVKNSEYIVVSSGYMPYVVVGKGSRQFLSSTSVAIFAKIVVKVGVTRIFCILICCILNGIVAIKLNVGSDVPAVVSMVVATTIIMPITNTLVTTVPTVIVIALRCDVESTWLAMITIIESDFPKTSGVVLGVCYAYNPVIGVIVV